MKMLIAIVNNDDAHNVNSSLSKQGFQVTKIASTGGFLMNGNSTFLMGVDDHRVDEAIDIIALHSKRRAQPAPMDMSHSVPIQASVPTEVTVGGAIVFVLDVEKHQRV